jgi:hypothetical protein
MTKGTQYTGKKVFNEWRSFRISVVIGFQMLHSTAPLVNVMLSSAHPLIERECISRNLSAGSLIELNDLRILSQERSNLGQTSRSVDTPFSTKL